MPYYKVMRRAPGNKLTSCVVGGEAVVCYKEGEWAEAPEWLAKEGHHLFVFDNLFDAVDFARDHYLDPNDIWEVEVEDEAPIPPACHLGCLYRGALDKRPQGYDKWPHGTRSFKRVKLIKRARP